MRNTEIDDLVPGHHVGHAWVRAASVAVVLATFAFLSTRPARRTFDAVVAIVFPPRVTLQVTPGNARVESGSLLAIQARLVGSRERVVAELEWGDGTQWRTADMTTAEDGQFYFRLDSVTTAFHYRILAGTLASPTYSVSIVTPAASTVQN